MRLGLLLLILCIITFDVYAYNIATIDESNRFVLYNTDTGKEEYPIIGIINDPKSRGLIAPGSSEIDNSKIAFYNIDYIGGYIYISYVVFLDNNGADFVTVIYDSINDEIIATIPMLVTDREDNVYYGFKYPEDKLVIVDNTNTYRTLGMASLYTRSTSLVGMQIYAMTSDSTIRLSNNYYNYFPYVLENEGLLIWERINAYIYPQYEIILSCVDDYNRIVIFPFNIFYSQKAQDISGYDLPLMYTYFQTNYAIVNDDLYIGYKDVEGRYTIVKASVGTNKGEGATWNEIIESVEYEVICRIEEELLGLYGSDNTPDALFATVLGTVDKELIRIDVNNGNTEELSLRLPTYPLMYSDAKYPLAIY
jgi:hypothetical protein